jgi:hypothetical protein
MIAATILTVGFIVAQIYRPTPAPGPVRIDTFDTKSRRTGYVEIDPRTGRYDSYDTRGNRLGYGYQFPAPGPGVTNPRDVELYNGQGQRIDGNKP